MVAAERKSINLQHKAYHKAYKSRIKSAVVVSKT